MRILFSNGDYMKIYYFMIHAVPKKDNPESEEFIGAFVNCWVKGSTHLTALNEAEKYIDSEGWTATNIEDAYITERERYIGDPDSIESLECYDAACDYGVAGIFYTYATEEDEENEN